MGSTPLSKGHIAELFPGPNGGSWGLELPSLGLGLLSAFRFSNKNFPDLASLALEKHRESLRPL